MTRVVLGSKWCDVPLIVRALMLPSTPHPTEQRRWQTDHDYILKPPAPRGYGYATPDDLHALGYNPELDRKADLEHWRMDLELAVAHGLITQQEGEDAWQSANQTSQNSSTSSTGTTSTTTQTPTKNPSSTASPTAAAGPPSRPPRKQAKARSSSPWQYRPHNKDTK